MARFSVLKVHGNVPQLPRYIFVPDSWVVTSRKTDSMVGVLYPTEEPRVTETRIKNKEPPSDAWNEYLCQHLHHTCEYEDAKIDVMTLRSKNAEQNPAPIIIGRRKSNARLPSNAPPRHIVRRNNSVNASTNNNVYQSTHSYYKLRQLNRNNENRNGMSAFNRYKTKWTLKYQEMEWGLQELIPGSKVYIKTVDLPAILNARNIEDLLRNLLETIYREKALTVCTYKRTNRRVDQDALQYLLKYASLVSDHKKWPKLSHRCLETLGSKIFYSIRNRLIYKRERQECEVDQPALGQRGRLRPLISRGGPISEVGQ